ncbi:TOBE domain-containing protein [Acuticoccus kandeliae]|uniref:TOBE domain-containing protein n=1 Tax=Acuticoccus kandeliae TaxID=2073160 RepID=UPI000D3E1AAC|nr:TOBE domain-containing protein [Acuticoccus kandeliae]
MEARRRPWREVVAKGQFLAAHVEAGRAALAAGPRLPVPALLRVADGTAIEIGIRPDDLSVASGPSDDTLPGRVDVVQELGTSRLVHVETAAGLLRLVQPASDARPDGAVHVRLDAARAMAFGETGARLT